MQSLMLLGWSHRSHICTNCHRRTSYRVNLLLWPPDRLLHVCIECYEKIVTPASLDACAGGSCET